MKNYLKIVVSIESHDIQELLIAQMNEMGFDGFEQKNDILIAFIEKNLLNKESLSELLKSYHLPYSIEDVPLKNWNEEWEKNYDPITVEDFVHVYASFHSKNDLVQHNILITPKMSFGTGHHATTYMMMMAMKQLNFNNKSVIDFGTGTGILAILAEKCGAKNVYAIDNDDWCIENTGENLLLNNCKTIKAIKDFTIPESFSADIILANINRNVLLSNVSIISNALHINGNLLLSGFYVEDTEDILTAYKERGFVFEKSFEKNNWCCLHMVKTFREI